MWYWFSFYLIIDLQISLLCGFAVFWLTSHCEGIQVLEGFFSLSLSLCRFSLALLLHQIEQTVQECLGVSDVGGETTKEPKAEPGVLRDTITHLQKQLKQSEETHKIELQESKVGCLSLQ